MSIHDKKDWLEDMAREWREAEVGEVREGDTVIVNSSGSGTGNYTVRPAHDVDLPGGSQAGNPNIRILQRAPEPERPEVVVASSIFDPTHERQLWFREPMAGWFNREEDCLLYDGELVDPVQLVELPSREEVIDALASVMMGYRFGTGSLASAVLDLLKGKR